MSFRDKAREVKAAGVAERGNFNPTGAPKRWYDFWLENTKSSKGRGIRHGTRKENFCHFWRVVLFWAPLWFLRVKVEKYGPAIGGIFIAAILIAGIAVLILVDGAWLIALQAVGAIVLLAIAIVAFIGGVSLSYHGDTRGRERNDLPSFKVAIVMSVLFPPAALTGYVLTWLFRFVGRGYDGLERRFGSKKTVIGTGILAALMALSIVGGIGGPVPVIWIVAITAALAVLVFLGILAFTFLSDYISGKRVLAAQRVAEYEEKYGEIEKPTKAPSKLALSWNAFWRGVGDFIIFIAQVVRVNKWKICPMVEIDEK